MARAILIQVVIAAVVGVLLCMLMLQVVGGDIRQALLLGSLFFLAASAVAILGWALLLALFRRRLAVSGAGARVGWGVLTAVIAGFFNLIIGGIVGTIIGGGDPFVFVFVLTATIAFGIGALIANLLTNLAIARPKPEQEPVV